LAGTIVVDRIESDASYTSTINVANRITFSNTVNFGVFAGTAPVAGFYLPTTNNLAFTTASTEHMRIDSAGNVGIGTSSPVAKLHVAGITRLVSGGATTGAIVVTQGFINGDISSSNFSIGNYGDSSSEMRIDTRGFTTFYTGATNNATGTERMRINSSGNVLIGGTSTTTHPALNKFVSLQSQTNNDVVGYGLYVNEGTNSRRGSLFLDDSTGLFGLDVTAGSGVPNIVFRTAGTEHVRITSADGNLLVNDTSGQYSAKLYVNGAIAARHGGADANYQDAFLAGYTGNYTEKNIIQTAVATAAASSGFRFMVSDGAGLSTTTQSFRINRTSCTVIGSLSKGSGSFKIDHPLPEKTETHHLVHSFIEGPQADLIYRGKVNLVAGAATVNIDTAARMTQGTFEVLCRDVQCFTTNESDWTAVRGSVTGNILTIEAQDNTSTASISWMVIGERQDKHMYDTDWTDESGKVIVEPLKEALENR